MSKPLGTAIGSLDRASRAALKQLRKPDRGDFASALSAVELVAIALDDARASVVDRMRSEGATWAEVGDALGISRQAAWERFSG